MVAFDSPLWKRLNGLDGSVGTAAAEVLQRMVKDEGEALQADLRQLALALMRGTRVNELTAAAFPHLVAQALLHRQIYDRLSILNLLSVLKPLMLGADLSGMEERLWQGYWESVYQLQRMTAHYLQPEACAELNEENRPFLARLYFLLVGQAADTLPFLLYSPFDAAFHIKCLDCGCDLYSMHVTPDALGEIPDITPCADEAAGGAVYQWFMDVLRRMEEPYYSKIMPYLYGFNRCPVCGQSNQVMALAQAYVEAEICPLAAHDRAEIAYLQAVAEAAGDNAERRRFYQQLAQLMSQGFKI